jgi:hypothetical protein
MGRSRVLWLMPLIPTMWEDKVGGSQSEAGPRQKMQDPM